jgi:hypothetical protein
VRQLEVLAKKILHSLRLIETLFSAFLKQLTFEQKVDDKQLAIQ